MEKEEGQLNDTVGEIAYIQGAIRKVCKCQCLSRTVNCTSEGEIVALK